MLFLNFLRNFFGSLICFINTLYIYIYIYIKYKLCFNNNYQKYEKLIYKLENKKFPENQGKIINYNIHYGCNIFDCLKIIDIISYLASENADIYIIQEFVNIKFKNGKDLIYYIKKCLNTPYHTYENILKIGNINYSNIIFSKKNILEVKVLNFKRWVLRMRNICISIKVKINDQEFWISNTHLNSDVTGYHQLFQAQELQKYIFDINETHLILGDFNSPSNFYSILYLKKKLKIIEENKLTYPSIYPLVKLDYCFTYNFEKEINIAVKKLKYSDHLPLIITVN